MKNITEYVLYELENDSSPEPVVTVFGDLNYDYIYNSPPLEQGREVIITGHTKTIAGAGGYISCGLAKLGAVVYLLTELGEDEDGKLLFNEIQNFGVKQDGIRLVKNKRSPFTLIFTEEREAQPRQVASYLGTLARLSIDSFDYKPYVEQSDLVYSCNYFLMHRLREEIRFVFRLARKKNILTSYDANAGDGWGDEPALVTLKNRIYPITDIIFLNESEACFLTGTSDPQKGILSICPEATTVVIKLGPRGAIIRHRDKLYMTGAFPLKGKPQDTVGAGDSFQAAFLYFYLKKFPIELCAILGAANAASTVLYRGGTAGQRDRGEIIRFIRDYSVIDQGRGSITIERS